MEATTAAGMAVTQAYFRARFTRITVASESAITASNWFAVPNILISALVPPSGSLIPQARISPHPRTASRLVSQTGIGECGAGGGASPPGPLSPEGVERGRR